MTGADIEQKLQKLLDRVEIEEVVADYAHTVDAHDFTAWAALFSEDGGYGSGDSRIPKSNLAAAAEGLLANYPHTHHFFGLPMITFRGNEADVRCPGVTHHVKVVTHPSQSSIVGGWLCLRLRKEDAAWRIVEAYADTSWTEGGDYFAGAAKVVEEHLSTGHA